MARFILQYDVCSDRDTKLAILNCARPSMVSPAGDSVQYCVVDLVELFGYEPSDKSWSILDRATGEYTIIDSNDVQEILNLQAEGVDYIEICF